ncbi:hypothetical protein [Micromonospora sp. NPDC049679]|uniref:hypothetical protein n=1 Tax=Micromonospora sp. NPDC049679 TaxID=3155920 RepID=UPI0033E1DA11
MIHRALLAAAAGIVAALAVAAPASAHGGDAPDGTNYRTAVTTVTPAVDGLTVRAVEAGARIELVNRGDRTIEVLGYEGEPYLEVRPDGVYQNLRSPAAYLNETLAGDTQPPVSADPTLPPSWQRISTEPVARWHDHRSHWMSATPPPDVRADPSRTHRVRDWVVPLRDGVSPVEIRGTLDWVPPPSPGLWWAVSLLGALAVGALGLLAAESRAGRAATVGLATLATSGGVLAIVYAVARELDAGATTVGPILQGLLVGQVWPLLAGLGAIAAAGYALARRTATDFALALAGACLAIFGGAANAAVFVRSIAPVPGPAAMARTAIAVVVAAGAGMALAGALRMHAASRAFQASHAPALDAAAPDAPADGEDVPATGPRPASAGADPA